MSDTITATSPVHHLLERHNPTWGRVGDMAIALDVADAAHADDVALCDVSALAKVGIKGEGAAAWLAAQAVDAPDALFEVRALDDGGTVVKVAGDEFFLESAPSGETVARIEAALADAPANVMRLERSGATFILSGRRVHEALQQTCGVNLAEEPSGRVLYSRVAGVSCGILPQMLGERKVFRLWLDGSYADYLWEQFEQIVSELGGGIVGARVHYLGL
jgi:heterotetrameric sarcosine oxidase gamma subunit